MDTLLVVKLDFSGPVYVINGKCRDGIVVCRVSESVSVQHYISDLTDLSTTQFMSNRLPVNTSTKI